MLRFDDRWVWDCWFAHDGERHHMFYLQADRSIGDPDQRHFHPSIGHATSADLRDWQVLDDALRPSAGPAFDDLTTWTGSVVRDDEGLWWMFYTGTSRVEGSGVQRVGSATSRDLNRWTRVDRHPIEATAEWYEKRDPAAWYEEAWRDPWVFRDPAGAGWRMLVTARAPDGEPDDRGVVGHAVSPDLRAWTMTPPLSEPGAGFGHLEVLQFAVVDGVPLVLFSCGDDRLAAWRRSGTPLGGVYSIVVDETLVGIDAASAVAFRGPPVYAARLVEHAGEWWMLGFLSGAGDAFIGAISDPIPVTATREQGVMLR